MANQGGYVTPAPSMVQNMIAPDIAAQQMQLQRRQQMIDMLKQQGTAPIEQQTVTGAGPARVVPISKFQGLAKILQAGAGAYMQRDADKQTAALNQDMSDRTMDTLNEVPLGTSKQSRMAAMLKSQMPASPWSGRTGRCCR